jgi:phage host-nuclease inhibitor protein Gam
MSTIKEQADSLLGYIAGVQTDLEAINREWDTALKKLEKQYGKQARELHSQIKALEKKLVRLGKNNKEVLFDETDRLELGNGALLWSEFWKVKRAKTVTPAVLEDLGYLDGLRIEKKINWDVLEEWPEDRLIAVGTERKKKVNLEYELKQ